MQMRGGVVRRPSGRALEAAASRQAQDEAQHARRARVEARELRERGDAPFDADGDDDGEDDFKDECWAGLEDERLGPGGAVVRVASVQLGGEGSLDALLRASGRSPFGPRTVRNVHSAGVFPPRAHIPFIFRVRPS